MKNVLEIALALMLVGLSSCDNAGNVAPKLLSADPSSVNVYEPFSYTVVTDDEEGDAVTVSVVSMPEFLTWSDSTMTLSGTPLLGDAGSQSVVLDLSDGTDSRQVTLTFTVNNNLDISEGIVVLNSDVTTNTTWTSDKEYLLADQVFVKNGATLTIQPGTVIKGVPVNAAGLAPALIIEKGAKIEAVGTAAAPITFTSALPADMLPRRGTWGGVIILGNAPTNVGGESFVEGLVGVPFGGNDPDDNSGTLKYVRVWYGGRSIGQDNEINGITLAGVGRGTTIDYCEVAFNVDDGFECFGGTVDLKHCDVLFVGDDAFDTDLGYRGRAQFLFGLIGSDDGNRGFEMDNDGNNMDGTPRSHPTFANVTLVGAGSGAVCDNDDMIHLREGTSADFRNFIIYDGKENGVGIKDAPTLALITNTAPAGTDNDDLYFSANNIIFGCAAQFADSYGISALSTDPGFTVTGRENGSTVDPRPTTDLGTVDALIDDGFFDTTVDYKGAFAPAAELWLAGWSWLSEANRLP